MPVKIWIKAARLRTLPLAIAGTLAGNLLAYSEQGEIRPLIFVLTVATALLLQILSNFANDYGDFKNGADTIERTDRVMASGLITEPKMKAAIAILIILCLITGIGLLIVSLEELNRSFWILLALGIGGLFAAYFYTAGKKPYGYFGLGDLSVFLFFGLLSVMGTYYLQTQTVESPAWFIAMSTGLLSSAVLNINNIRDIRSDEEKHKITLPVKIGYKNALAYHFLLLTGALLCVAIYTWLNYKSAFQVFFLVVMGVVLLRHYSALQKAAHKGRPAYNRQLKLLSLSTLGLTLCFCLSEVIYQ